MSDDNFWKEFDEWYELFNRFKKPLTDLPKLSEFPDVYPEGKTIISKNLKIKKKELKELQKEIADIKKQAFRLTTNLNYLELHEDLLLAVRVGNREKELTEDIYRLEKLQRFYHPKFLSKSSNFIDKELVKHIPISDYVDFNRAGNAPCLWHDDKNPSMHYYKGSNTVYCFSCQKSGDILDVIQAQHNCDFKKALSILRNGS